MREAGVEPARPCEHWHLKPASLPIPPLARPICLRRFVQRKTYITITPTGCQHFFQIFYFFFFRFFLSRYEHQNLRQGADQQRTHKLDPDHKSNRSQRSNHHFFEFLIHCLLPRLFAVKRCIVLIIPDLEESINRNRTKHKKRLTKSFFP